MTKSCATCVWLGKSEQAELTPQASHPKDAPVPVLFGTCRYNPPVLVEYEEGFAASFPSVIAGDWCRHHSPSMGDPTS